MKIFCVALLSFIAFNASADVPPPPGYVESCTIEKQQKANEECVSCSGNFRNRDACAKKYAIDGYTARCKTRGASVWGEVWCRTKAKK